MKQKLLALFSVILLVNTVWVTFLSPDRYGSDGDSRLCGQNTKNTMYLTAASYLLFTASSHSSTLGACFYQSFTARTYAADLWAMTVLCFYLTHRATRPTADTSI